jgi:hypothetical protein
VEFLQNDNGVDINTVSITIARSVRWRINVESDAADLAMGLASLLIL